MTSFADPAPDPPRRRFLTILFADLSGSTALSEQLEVEDYAELLERLRDIYHRVTAKNGGVVAQISGDGMLALFGYPEAREGDARRAVEAAVELHAAVRELAGQARWGGAPLRLHSGMHSGLVLLYAGDEVRGRFELLGTTTNIASRLCSLAEPDEIVVSEATLGPDRRFFRATRRDVCVRGRVEPIGVLTILGRLSGSSTASRPQGDPTPFVGRETELARLAEAVAASAGGAPRFVRIEGQAGIGKTRLAEEALAQAMRQRFAVHRGDCTAEAEPLQPFLQIARSLLGLTDAEPRALRLEDVAAALAPLSLAAEAASVHQLLSRSRDVPTRTAVTLLAALLTAAAAAQPLALFIDDWQWADDVSRDLLAELRDLADRPLLVLLTTRPTEGSEPSVSLLDTIALQPLSSSQIGKAVAALLPSPDPFTVADIDARSGGNPLFIEELCHAVAAGGAGDTARDGSGWLDLLIESRVARLPAPQAQIVRAASVIGAVIPAWLLKAVAPGGLAALDVAELAARDLIFGTEREGNLRFKHGLTRDAVYRSVGLHERRALHLKIAEALRDRAAALGEEEPYEALATHYAGREDPVATAHYAELAGDRALAASALDRAQTHYRVALGAIDRLPQTEETVGRWHRVVQRFALAGVFDPSPEQLPVLEDALERATRRGDALAQMRARYWLGYLGLALGDMRASIRHLSKAAAASSATADDRIRVQVRATLGQAQVLSGDYAAALPLLDGAVSIKRRHRTGVNPSVGMAFSLSCRGFAMGDMSRFDEADACFAEALEVIAGSQHEVESSILCQRSAVSLWQGRVEDALHYAQRAEKVAERSHTIYLYITSRSMRAYAEWLIDGSPDALALMRADTQRLEEGGRLHLISLKYGWLADAMIRSGDFLAARPYAARALQRARNGDVFGEAMTWRALAHAASAGAFRRPVSECLTQAQRAAERRSAPHEHLANQRCAQALGMPELGSIRADLIAPPSAIPAAAAPRRRAASN